jgi:hypothetical protein
MATIRGKMSQEVVTSFAAPGDRGASGPDRPTLEPMPETTCT